MDLNKFLHCLRQDAITRLEIARWSTAQCSIRQLLLLEKGSLCGGRSYHLIDFKTTVIKKKNQSHCFCFCFFCCVFVASGSRDHLPCTSEEHAKMKYAYAQWEKCGPGQGTQRKALNSESKAGRPFNLRLGLLYVVGPLACQTGSLSVRPLAPLPPSLRHTNA